MRGGGAMQLRLSGYQGLRTSMDNKSYDFSCGKRSSVNKVCDRNSQGFTHHPHIFKPGR